MLDKRIDELDISVRTYNAVRFWGCETVRDVIQMIAETPGVLFRTPNFGKKSRNELLDLLGIHPTHPDRISLAKLSAVAQKKPRREPGTSVYLLQSDLHALLQCDIPPHIKERISAALPKVR